MVGNETRILNLSGEKLEIYASTWALIKKNVPTELQKELHERQNDIFVERSAVVFRSVLDYYLCGKLHMSANVCPSSFKTELGFWGIEPQTMEKCCYQKYVAFFEDEQVLRILETDENRRLEERSKLTSMTRRMGWTSIQAYVWLVLNEPFYSRTAKAYFVLSSLMVSISLAALIAGTHPEFQRSLYLEEWQAYFGEDWGKYKQYFILETEFNSVTEVFSTLQTTSEPESSPEPETSSASGPSAEPEAESEPTPDPEVETEAEPEAESEPTSEPEVRNSAEPEPLPVPENAHAAHSYLVYIDYVCVAFFTFDILVRVIFCPFKVELLISFLFWVDVFALGVTCATYVVESLNPREKYEASVMDMLHCLQIVRVFRLFRVVKNFIGFRVLYYAFKASISEMLLMIWFLLVAMLFFSAFAFFSGDDTFPSIPDAFWWVVVTMTTVGYGDVVPKQGLSKLIGALCAVAGVCLLAVIIPVFVNNFMLFYSYSKVWGKKQEQKDNSQRSRDVRITQVQTIGTDNKTINCQ